MKYNVVWKRTEIEQKGIYASIHLFIRIFLVFPKSSQGIGCWVKKDSSYRAGEICISKGDGVLEGRDT